MVGSRVIVRTGVAVVCALGFAACSFLESGAVTREKNADICRSASARCSPDILAALESPKDVTYTTRAPVTVPDMQSMASQDGTTRPPSQRATDRTPPADVRRRQPMR